MSAQTPTDSFLAWQAAVQAAAELREPLVGRRVRALPSPFSPMAVSAPLGTIKDVRASGFMVLWDGSGRRESCHPDFLVFL